ncbi:MAG: shikimate dehydrogenase [Bacteroidia bacterium]|jgi:shikimate dehydrogenase|nr:shikimate dehydrogenase [Bacteroidia bacterium]
MRVFGLIGYPLTHSFSPQYFADKFQREGITDAHYHLFPLEEVEELGAVIHTHPDLCGFNVTIPHKQSIMPLLDSVDEVATAAGAVNTVKLVRGEAGKHGNFSLHGTNTDVYGFRQSLKPFLTSAHERALILGTGGAAAAVDYVLRQIGVETVFVSSSGKTIQGRTVLAAHEVNEYVIAAFKLIVNTTPLGMFPDTETAPSLPYEKLTHEHLLYDLVYNPPETRFMQLGRQHGATAMNGLDMLKLQAEKAWEFWNS